MGYEKIFYAYYLRYLYLDWMLKSVWSTCNFLTNPSIGEPNVTPQTQNKNLIDREKPTRSMK